ncbi:unnamed protein product [Prorocentrum cordatum]|uniref:FH2 domain-containing protein n=1 Tax=Prorocentrum cordatum TaxID=2364126 RepID=A0ABN9T5N5_9DINO|nr:unnamed protein product [Polarella glacialis]
MRILRCKWGIIRRAARAPQQVFTSSGYFGKDPGGGTVQVVKYVKPVEGDPKVKDDNFNSKMEDFATQAQEKIAGLKEQVTQVADLTKQCCDMFEKPKTPSGEFLAKFALFRKHMEEARRENLLAKAKKEKAEKKRAEKEQPAEEGQQQNRGGPL